MPYRKKLILLIIALQFCYSVFAQFQFEKLTTKDGLSLDNIECISQDNEGLVYFGTNGLNVYDGNVIKTYDVSNTEGFGNRIKSILPVSSTKIFIGSLDKGLFLLDKEFGRIQKIPLAFNKELISLPILSVHDDEYGKIWIGTLHKGLFSISKESVINNKNNSPLTCTKYHGSENYEINSICSFNGKIWIGTRYNGLFEVETKGDEFNEWRSSNIHLSSKNIWVLKIFNDSLFIGTQGGLNLIDLQTKSHRVFLEKPNSPTLTNNIVRAICRDKSGIFWIGTQEDGLYSLNFRKSVPEIIHFKNTPTNSNTINVNKILSLYAGERNNLWIGTWNGGVNILSFHNQQFINIRNKGKENDLSENMVWSIEQIEQGKYLIGTHGNGICSFESDKNFFKEKYRTKNVNSVASIYLDKSTNILWVGTWGKGLKAFSYPEMTPVFEHILDTALFNDDRIYLITKDKYGIIWVGTATHGVFRINLNDIKQPVKYINLFEHNRPNGTKESAEVRSIISDNSNTLWIGSLNYGLYKATTNKHGDIVDAYRVKTINDEDETYAPIRGLYLQSNGNLWIGQENGKIKIYDTLNDSCKSFSTASNNIVQRFTEDNKGNMWIATYHGLIKYNSTTNSRQTFLSESSFYSLFFDSESNKLIAGSNKGIFTFNPSQLKGNPFYPEIIFSQLKIFNKTINPGSTIKGNISLKKALNYTDTLFLPHSYNVFSIEITALSFVSSKENQIWFQLENFERSWNKRFGAATTVTYTNLSPGEYKLKVKVANKDNVWNPEIRVLTIVILPPWWRTYWAYLGYFILLIITGALIIRIIRDRIRTNHALKIEKVKKEQSDILNEQKLSFFTNISHEIRTPLTLILDPLETILENKNLGEQTYRQLVLMQKNANVLLQLVCQILDFRKIEKGKTKLNVVKINLNEFVLQTLEQFEGKASPKNISLQFQSKSQKIKLWVDFDLLQKILFNLLSNAIKYNNKKGYVHVSIEETSTTINIKIKDNGIGIDKKDLPNIFNRFYQSDNNVSGGSGIGLSLVQRMVELHQVKILVESQPGKGSVFSIIFKKGKEHFNHLDIVEKDSGEKDNGASSLSKFDSTIETKQKPTVIIIDDNDDIRLYIKENLSVDYNTIDFDNAAEALTMAQTKDVSLIICDIMMPGMDGMEFCEKIKSDIKTSHIPIILLTAKTATESKIKGFEKGADEYISKPFSTKLLKARIGNLIEQREKMKKKIERLNLEPSKITPTSLDEQFLRKTIQIIEKNISDNDYSIDDLSLSMGLSHDNFYRKVKNLTGMSAAKFIRMIRLKRAKQMIENTDYSISEILYEVGFSSPSYFAKCFKKQFGVSPTEYQKSN